MFDDERSSGGGTVFRDVIMLALLGFVAMVVWMLPHLNPPQDDDQTKPPGNLIAYVTWKPGPIDVDLWLTGPGEEKPVGYSRKSGVLWDLLRDDLGTRNDDTPMNFENAYTRGIVPGEYALNVHCYDCPKGQLPIVVTLELSLKKPGSDGKGSIKRLLVTKVTLHEENQERVLVRFRLTKDGSIVKGSVSRVFEKMRSSDS